MVKPIIEKQRRDEAFTLAELLVALAVIAILVAIVLPVFIQARNRARMVSCASNLRQIGKAVLLYSQDWNDRLPNLSRSAFSGQGAVDNWPDGTSATIIRTIIWKYTRSSRVFVCASEGVSPAFGFKAEEGKLSVRTGSSYVPWATARSGDYGIPLNGGSISSLQSASANVLFMDYGTDWHGYMQRDGMSIESISRVNAVFSDGHAGSLGTGGLTKPESEYTWITTTTGTNTGCIRLDGSAGSANAELTGTYANEASSGNRQRLKLRLSGVVMVGELPYNVDREFTFGENTPINTAMRQVASWIESLINQ